MYSRIISSLSLLAIALALIACEDMQSSPTPLRVGTNVWPGYEPLYLARHLDKWPEQKIRLVEYPSATEVMRAFRNRSLEAASLTLDEVLLLRQDNIPVKVVLVHDVSNGGDVILAHPGIDTVKDLKGKRIAVESNALGAFVITRALELNGLSTSDVQIKSFDVNLHQVVFLNKDVDAVVTFEPVRTKLLNSGAKEIFTSREIPNEIVDVLVVHEDYLNRHPEVVQMLINGWFDATDYMQADMRNASHILAKRQHVTANEIVASYDGLHIPSREENQQLLGGSSATLTKTLALLNRVLSQHNLIQKTVDINNLLSTTMLDYNDKQ